MSENAVLTFNVPTGVVRTNALGNRVVETAKINIRAMLTSIKDAAEINYYVGDDDTSLLMSGYLIEPLLLPSTLSPPIDGEAVIKVGINNTQKGNFKLLPQVQSPYLVALKINYLTSIMGIFRSN